MRSAIEGVKRMGVYVVVEMLQGIVSEVRVFTSKVSAQKVEKSWLKQHDISDTIGRECKAQDGTEVTVHECEIER